MIPVTFFFFFFWGGGGVLTTLTVYNHAILTILIIPTVFTIQIACRRSVQPTRVRNYDVLQHLEK